MYRKPLKIKNIEIKNRIAIPPMVCFNWSDDNGYVVPKNVEHYRELAEGGAGLIIVEATAITKRGRLGDTELGLWEDAQTEGFKQIVTDAHKNGAKIFVQLVNAGGNSVGNEPEGPSSFKNYRGITCSEMSKERINETVSDFATAALRAKAAGFDGIELHGCHGYMISQFFNSRVNKRNDEYGQDKSLFAKEVIKAVRKAVGDDYILGIRIGAFEPLLEDGLEHALAIADLVDFMDVSYGGDCDGTAPEGFSCSEAVYGASCIKKALPNMPVFGVHNINSREDVINALNTGIDMADIGKAALVDPAFANHIINGPEEGHCLHCKNYCRWNPGEMADPDKKCPGFVKYNK